MARPHRQQITELLLDWNRGDPTALDRLTPLVYEELRRVAQRHMRRESPGHPLQATALVHEAYLRLVDAGRVPWRDRSHFFAIAARLMRQILVDMARSRRRLKRGGDAPEISLESVDLAAAPDLSLPELDEALSALAAVDERKSRVVELRYFGGLTVEETAEVLAVSRETVLRDWRFAKLWLLRELSTGSGR